MTRKIPTLLIAFVFLITTLLSTTSGIASANASSVHKPKGTSVAAAPEPLTKWQRDSALLAKYNKKSSVKVTKKTKRIAKLYALHYLDTKYKSDAKRNKQHKCMIKVFNYESKWNWKARSSNGYYGIPQTKSSMKKHGKNWRKHYAPQIKWGFNYMKKRYGSPCGAAHKIKKSGWY